MKIEKISLNKITGVAIIVECCNDCPFIQKTHCGKQAACGEPHNMASRPYIDSPNAPERSRKVDGNTHPAWCPLDKSIVEK